MILLHNNLNFPWKFTKKFIFEVFPRWKPDAHANRFHHCRYNFSPYPCRSISQYSHLSILTNANKISKIFTPNFSRSRHHKICKSSMFHLHDSLVVKTLFLFSAQLVAVIVALTSLQISLRSDDVMFLTGLCHYEATFFCKKEHASSRSNCSPHSEVLWVANNSEFQ